MHKIVLFDNNTPSYWSSTKDYYIEDLEDFKRRWFKLIEDDEERKERFEKAMQGEIVSDGYIVDSPAFSMVQKINEGKFYIQGKVELNNQILKSQNGYGLKANVWVKDFVARVWWVCFDGELLKIADFKADGIAKQECDSYVQAFCHGNPVLESSFESMVYRAKDTLPFEDDKIESIAFCVVNKFKSEEELFQNFFNSDGLTEEEISRLLQDIIGEAG